MVFSIQSGISHVIAESPVYVDQIPNITINDGQVSINKPVPYFIRDPHTKAIIAIIDTSGTIQSLEHTTAKFLLTQNQLIIKSRPSETRIIDLSKADDFVVNRLIIYDWLDKVEAWAIYAIFPLIVILSFCYRFIQILVYGLFGMIFNAIVKAQLSYGTLVRLSAFALTPTIAIFTALSLFSISFHFSWLLAFFLSMAYLFFGIVASKQKKIEPTKTAELSDTNTGKPYLK